MTKVYFNELSAKGSVCESDVKTVFDNLVSCLQYLNNHNVDNVIVNGNVGECFVTDNRTLFQLLGNSNVFDNDKTAFLLDSFYENYKLKEEIEDENILTAKCHGFDSVGLTLASDYVCKSLALSLSNSGWDDSEYDVQLEVLDGDGNVSNITASAKNVSTKEGLTLCDGLFPVSPIQAPKSGKLLYNKLEALFPNLVFSADAKDFVKRCQSKDMTAQIFLKLIDLNKVAAELNARPLVPSMFASLANPESKTRDNMEELDVTFDDDIVRHCSWHLRFTPGAGRIHFSTDASDGNTIYVGYVGQKLNPKV